MEYKACLVTSERAKKIRGKPLNSFCTEQAQRLALKGEHGSGTVKDASTQKKLMSSMHHDTERHDAEVPQCQSMEQTILDMHLSCLLGNLGRQLLKWTMHRSVLSKPCPEQDNLTSNLTAGARP